MIPILLITYNRLPYSIYAFSSIVSRFAGTDVKITIWDNNSTDDTRVWLKHLQHPDIEEIVVAPENMGIAKPMNYFLRKHKDFDYVCKVDNDTVLQKNWLVKILRSYMHHDTQPQLFPDGEIGAISGFCLRPSGLTADAWYQSMYKFEIFGKELRKNSYICGTGVVINMKMIRDIGFLSESEPCLMGGWTSYCRIVSDIIKGYNFYFDMDVFCKLLNLEDDHKLSGDFPEYDLEMKKIRDDGNEWWEAQGGLNGIYKHIIANGGFPKE